MQRRNREYSVSNVYHVVYRGNDRHDIFYDEEDRYVLLKYIKELIKKYNIDVFSYCLMSNHIHLVQKVEKKNFSKAMQSLAIKYSMYFNKKYNRTGHLFENRFYSKKVENLDYFIHLCKYIHRNPEKANLCKTEEYKWSSFKEYLGKEYIINKNILLHYFDNNLEQFVNYTLTNDDLEDLYKFAEFEIIKKLTDDELSNIIKAKIGVKNASDISLFNEEKRKSILLDLKLISGTNLNQLSRVTKINRYYLEKIWHSNFKN